MQTTQPLTHYPTDATGMESARSAVSWAAVIAGAVIAASVSVMLLTGGTGLGFLSMSPWRNTGASGSALAIGSIVWLLITQIIAYGVAGYITGRLRTKWTDAASDEIYFRDTAHGFLVWALSAVVGLVLLGSTVTSVLSGTARAGATLAGAGAGAATAAAGQAAHGDTDNLSLDYFTDALLRPNDPSGSASQGDVRQETSRILARSLVNGQLSDADRSYLVKIVAQRAGVDEATAQQRLTQVETQAKQAAQEAEQKAREAADQARKAAAAFSLWAFASLLIGAFVASFTATLGGRARDR
ncbi:hypothetical protein CY652_09195 [Burkholderia sp. WAC0059]|uniref:hypothetical protein n=1 Tax=Burkholderia sp. WAC0059 TaxID=2066022 RepID=UPI000C7F2BB5|nr:hypothetical protein [Burkholderia sp. WAC0059]PLZ02700.1 hypothetical protein CY652_09195 [Burkholderia sp. WAC0059]